MKVIITGINGYIGSHVGKWLREKGWYVIGLDRHDFSKNEVDEYIYCDLFTEKTDHLLDYLNVDQIDAVIHLASDMRKEPYTKEVLASNCVGTQRLLEFCEREKVKVFVQLSSLPVIGKPVLHPIKEDHPLAPPTVYHVTKHTQELLANYAYYKFGLRTVSLRITSPVGVGINPQTILPVFIKNAMQNKDIILFGKGTRKQNYIHVRDIAQAIYKSILSNAQGVFNLASDVLVSNVELAQKCLDIIPSKSQIVYSGVDDPMDNDVWDVSLEKLKKATGYSPELSVDIAIKEIWEAYRKEID